MLTNEYIVDRKFIYEFWSRNIEKMILSQNTEKNQSIFTMCCFVLLGSYSITIIYRIWAVSQSHDAVEHNITLKVSHHRSLHWACPSISGGSRSNQPRPKDMYPRIINLPEFEIYFTEEFVSTDRNWPKYRVTLLTVLFIRAPKWLLFICYDSRFVLT